MDIVLNKTQAEQVGYLYDDSLLPVLGNHPLKMSGDKECTLTTPAQGKLGKLDFKKSSFLGVFFFSKNDNFKTFFSLLVTLVGFGMWLTQTNAVQRGVRKHAIYVE